jgi:hypothetical protein
MIVPSKIFLASGSRRRVFRSVALLLAVVIAGHLLPLTYSPVEHEVSRTEADFLPSFEPLQVCDDGSGFLGFLADHPWMPASDLQTLITADRTCCPPPPEGELSEGIPSAVFRPPRLILS